MTPDALSSLLKEPEVIDQLVKLMSDPAVTQKFSKLLQDPAVSRNLENLLQNTVQKQIDVYLDTAMFIAGIPIVLGAVTLLLVIVNTLQLRSRQRNESNK